MPTGEALSGGGKRVYRKDVLGYLGKCHDRFQLHLEIFMLPADYTAYFGATQFEVTQSVTPTGTDYWGHSYYVIPAGQTFSARPAGVDSDNKLNGIVFKPLQDGQNERPLYVESYFHKGSKYTTVWNVAEDGARTVLVRDRPEPKYEYDLYTRATNLYPACPSDGYELLRFGRILSNPATLADGAARATWTPVAFEAGKEGYIDINNVAIAKLSDADFPTFMHWKKITEGDGPFNSDGLCDIGRLKTILGDAHVSPISADANLKVAEAKNDEVSQYLNDPDHAYVREQLRGFICEAPTEWDVSNVETRYAKLLGADGYFEGKSAAYEKFIKFAKQFCFWDRTGLDGAKLWFFHPLQFVRHFRKCGWLDMCEFEQIYSNKRYSRNQRPSPSELRLTYLGPLNLAVRKYGMTSSTRLAHFLGQGAVESAWLTSMQETSMLGHLDAAGFHGTVINQTSQREEANLGHWYGELADEDDAWFRSVKFNSHGARITGSYDWKNGNCDQEDAQKFRGRGFKQLTGRSNYAAYWVFRGWLSASRFSQCWWDDPAFRAHNRRNMINQPAQIAEPQRVAQPLNCIDSGGFYLRGERPNVAREIDADTAEAAVTVKERQTERLISRSVTYAINGGYIDDVRRLEATRAAKEILS
jgi:hypothetical protein